MDLPKVSKWLSRENECGKKVSSKDWCQTGNKSYVWELVAFKLVWDIADWAYAEAPFAYMMALGADGIAFTEQGNKNVVNRCFKFESFQPVQQADYQTFDMFTPNQWSIEERTVGPKNIIRPVINKSTDYVPVLDGDGRGIVCFYDRLFIANYINYTLEDKERKFGNISFMFEFVFQPVQMERYDYLEHLISRTKCNSICFKQNVYELPCFSDCLFKDARDYKDDEKLLVRGHLTDDLKPGELAKDMEITGKEAKDPVRKPKPCWTVCEVGTQPIIPVCPKNIDRMYSWIIEVQLVMLMLKHFNSIMLRCFPDKDGPYIPWGEWHDKVVNDPKRPTQPNWLRATFQDYLNELTAIIRRDEKYACMNILVLQLQLMTVLLNSEDDSLDNNMKQLIHSQIIGNLCLDLDQKIAGIYKIQTPTVYNKDIFHYEKDEKTLFTSTEIPYEIFLNLPVTIPQKQTSKSNHPEPEFAKPDPPKEKEPCEKSPTDQAETESIDVDPEDVPSSQYDTGTSGIGTAGDLSDSQMET